MLRATTTRKYGTPSCKGNGPDIRPREGRVAVLVHRAANVTTRPVPNVYPSKGASKYPSKTSTKVGESLTASNNNSKTPSTSNGTDAHTLSTPGETTAPTPPGKRYRVLEVCPPRVVAKTNHMVAPRYPAGTPGKTSRNGTVERIVCRTTYRVLRGTVFARTCLYNNKVVVESCDRWYKKYRCT